MPLFVDILTPHQRVVKDTEVDALSVPTHRGQIHILPGHTHLLSEVCPGHVSLFGGRDDPDRFFFRHPWAL